MKYIKYDMSGYFLHVIETNKFKTININLNIKRESKKEEITLRDLLINTLIDSSKKFPTRKEIEIETEELYGLGLNINLVNSGKCNLISLNETFLNNKYIDDDILERAISYLNEIVFNPNVENNEFNIDSFNLAKRILKNNIESLKDNPSSYGRHCLLKEINPNNPLTFIPSIEELENITPNELYEYYNNVINNDEINIFVIGDVNSEEIKKIFEKVFTIKNRNTEKINHYIIENNIGDGNIYKEKLPINQSKLLMGYNFKQVTEFENQYVSSMLSYILGGSADSMLFKVVREKESLCYSINSGYNQLSGILIIYAGIDSDKYDKTKELIANQIEEIKKGNFTDEDLENGKKIYKNSALELFDSPNSIINMYMSHEYIGSDLYEDKIKNIDKVTKEDIISLANKLHLNKIVLIEGEEDEENNN